MSVDMAALREADQSVDLIDRRILSIANQLINRRLEGLGLSRTRVINVPIDMGIRGTALTVGEHAFYRLSLGGTATVLAWSVAATKLGLAAVGSVTLDVQTGATLAGCTSITGTGKPAMAAVSELPDQVPSGWTTTTIADPSWVYVNVTAISGALEVVNLTLKMAISS